MKKLCSLTVRSAILAFMVLVFGLQAYANEASQFNQFVLELHKHRAKMELKLGLDPEASVYPHATSYYDDKVDHYEQVLIMSDFIDQGIR